MHSLLADLSNSTPALHQSLQLYDNQPVHPAGGQFAFVEIITAMRRPSHFPRASFISLFVLVSAYFALGSVGYWSQVRPCDDATSHLAPITSCSLGRCCPAMHQTSKST